MLKLSEKDILQQNDFFHLVIFGVFQNRNEKMHIFYVHCFITPVSTVGNKHVYTTILWGLNPILEQLHYTTILCRLYNHKDTNHFCTLIPNPGSQKKIWDFKISRFRPIRKNAGFCGFLEIKEKETR